MTNFNEKIKKFRKQKDMTQEQLAEYMAEYMCVSPQAISRWETGVTCPDISALPQLAELFDVTIDELLGVDEKEKRQEINAVITAAEEKINNTGETEESIIKLREALNKYPNNERLLCSLMYALYVALFTPVLKSTPSMFQQFHHSQATLPGLIHDVSATLEGAARR